MEHVPEKEQWADGLTKPLPTAVSKISEETRRRSSASLRRGVYQIRALHIGTRRTLVNKYNKLYNRLITVLITV